MVLTSEISWTDLVQTVIAVAAFLAFPTTVIRLWNLLRYSYLATMRPVDPGPHGADTWQISLLNRSYTSSAALKCTIMPQRPGCDIAFAVVQTHEDGGFHVEQSLLAAGAFELAIDRMAPRREIVIAVRMTMPDVPFIQSHDRALRRIVSDVAEWAFTVLHLRMSVLMIQLCFGYLLIIGRLIYLGLSK